MSNQVNTQLYERASEMIEFWTGTQHAQRIEYIMSLNDLDELERAVREAESEAYREIKNEAYSEAQDEMTPERAEAMYVEAERKLDGLREDGVFKEFGDVF